MTTLMRTVETVDREDPRHVPCETRTRVVGTRSADYIRASGHSGRIQRPNTWLHPTCSLRCPIFLLHRGRRPYMAHWRRELISAFWSRWGERRTSRSRQWKSEFDRAPFDRHLLGSLPTLIFHLAAVEAHGGFMVAVAQFRQKNGSTSLCCHGLYRKCGRERCWRVSQ
jgi:hypothetical protein